MRRFTQVLEATRTPLRAFHPFTAEIQAVEIPPGFREPVIGNYNGTRDPQSHVDAFQTQMFISCKMFVGKLTEVVLKWFKGLPVRSVTGFEDLAGRFVHQFSANKKKELWLGDLFDIRQGPSESLKNYLDQFNKATVLVEEPDEKLCCLHKSPTQRNLQQSADRVEASHNGRSAGEGRKAYRS